MARNDSVTKAAEAIEAVKSYLDENWTGWNEWFGKADSSEFAERIEGGLRRVGKAFDENVSLLVQDSDPLGFGKAVYGSVFPYELGWLVRGWDAWPHVRTMNRTLIERALEAKMEDGLVLNKCWAAVRSGCWYFDLRNGDEVSIRFANGVAAIEGYFAYLADYGGEEEGASGRKWFVLIAVPANDERADVSRWPVVCVPAAGEERVADDIPNMVSRLVESVSDRRTAGKCMFDISDEILLGYRLLFAPLCGSARNRLTAESTEVGVGDEEIGVDFVSTCWEKEINLTRQGAGRGEYKWVKGGSEDTVDIGFV